MNYKYFGNSLDLLKFDILTYLSKTDVADLFYIPMLTEPEPKKLDPKYKVYEIGIKNNILLSFLLKAINTDNNLDVSDIRSYFQSMNINYKIILNKTDADHQTFTINNIQYFTDENRNEYFEKTMFYFKNQTNKSILFLDPCVGLDLGVNRRVRSMRKLYLNEIELNLILNNTKNNDVVCYFQHLGNHTYSLTKRLEDLKSSFGKYVLIVGYERILGSLVFIFKTERDYEDKKIKFKEYFKQYENIKFSNKIILL